MGELQEEVAFNFLSDIPETEDGFSGKGHERSARSLASALTQMSNNGGSIGLEGAWGSGKTTVVALAEHQLRQRHSTKFHFFTFDLWANQSVDFRRAFLEGFLRWSKPYLGNKHEDLVKRVQGKTKKVDTESKREFSVFGYILMSVLFFLPFLLLWLSPFSANLHKTVSSPDAGTVEAELPWIFQQLYEYGHIGAIVLIGVVVIGFLWQIGNCLWREKYSLREALDSSFSLLARKSDKETVTQTIRDGDPTQYEFHEIFAEIVSSVQSSHRRVIFVFDNIDRLPVDSIQEVWAHVRSVFSSDSVEEKDRNSIVTVVVPYDRKHVLSAFDSVASVSSSTIMPTDNSARLAYALEDIVRKTFNAVITVSPPVTSHVRGFFDNCLERALPKQFDVGKKHRLFRVFDVFLTEQLINPTPRQVKSFINDVGMLWEQWQGKLPIESIGIFVLHRSKLEAEPKSLQRPDTINARYRHFVTTDKLDQDLAALAFNVEPEIALEVLLKRDIISALLQEKNDHLMALSLAPGFDDQLEDILHEHCAEWASNSLTDFEAALKNYVTLATDSPIKDICNKHFVQAISSLGKVDITEWEQHKELFLVASCIPEPSLGQHVRAIVEWLSRALPEELTEQLGRDWIGAVGAFLHEVKKSHGKGNVASVVSTIHVPYSPEFYLGVALDCDEAELRFSQFKNVARRKASEIGEALFTSGTSAPDRFRYQWFELQFALSENDQASVFTSLIEHVRNNTLEEQEERQDYFHNLVLVAANCRSNDAVISSVKAAIKDGSLPWHADKLNESEDWPGLANAVWLVATTVKAGTLPQLTTHNREPFGELSVPYSWFKTYYDDEVAPNVLAHIAELVIKYSEVDAWLSDFVNATAHTLYKGVLSKIFASDDCPALILQTLIRHYEVLEENFDTEVIEKIVKKVGQEASFEQLDKVKIPSLPPSFVKAMEDDSNEVWETLLTRVDQHLKGLTKEEWEDALTGDNNHNRGMLFARKERLGGSVPPNNLRIPLADFIADVMTLKVDAGQDLEGYSVFWTVLLESSRRGLASELLDRLSEHRVDPAALLIVLHAFPDLFAQFPLKDRAAIVVSKILLPLLTGDVEKALPYVEASGSSWADCVASVDDELRMLVAEHLLEPEDADDESPSQVYRLRVILKLSETEQK